ncbi:MAG: dihydrodipicolinate synthase family protein, partial [Saprospiraceae bacterium]|nr:dihydrodipicolinate synthase family protein [Saprospiraceae bacterium]
MKKFRGVWPALITPISSDGQPNLVAMEELVELLISQNLDGLYILGSTGQGILLTESQRMTITEVVASIVRKRIPIMVQVGSLTTAESVRLARHAEVHEADAISSVGPIYYSASNGSAQMALNHYRSIAESTGLPFFPYQLGQSNFSEGIPLFVEKLLEIPNVAGMKLTT